MLTSKMATFIDMWQERPILYKNVSKGYSHQNRRFAARSEMAEVIGISRKGDLERRSPPKGNFKIVHH